MALVFDDDVEIRRRGLPGGCGGAGFKCNKKRDDLVASILIYQISIDVYIESNRSNGGYRNQFDREYFCVWTFARDVASHVQLYFWCSRVL